MASARAPLPRLPPRPARRRRSGGDVQMFAPSEASATLLSALSTVETQERYFLAGGLCASISHALACPIDVIKTRQQTMPQFQDVSLSEGLLRVASDEGPAALFTGGIARAAAHARPCAGTRCLSWRIRSDGCAGATSRSCGAAVSQQET